MAITYNKSEIKNRIREPLLRIDRLKFKSPRNSLAENVETNLLKIDLTRILNELDSIDIQILNKVTYFIGNVIDYTETAKLNDGITTELDGIEIYIDDTGAVENALEIDSMNKLSGKLARLFYKVSLLENGIWNGRCIKD